MKFLSRLLVVLCVLGGLGYGSYVFGRYVLSKHLFGALHKQSVSTVASASISKTDLRGGKPRVEVEVLSADSAGPGPALPPSAALERHAVGFKSDSPTSLAQLDKRNHTSTGSKADTGTHLGQREFDNASGMDVNDSADGSGDSSQDGYSRRRSRNRYNSDRYGQDRPRRRHRTHSSDTSSQQNDYSAPATRDQSSTREIPSRADSGGSSGFERPARRSGGSGDGGERSHRARSESSDARGSSGSSESPIPRAEGSGGGGESPIPKPE